ncbi:MAG: hypothetical protein CL907_02925 [Dehalococcoidia bacterium]|nr:hypothetical protein [Dehalococcoidia bacterium]MBM32562.1 hypothetical protein [Chloroflexota bacterium]MEC7921053.1 hypothetical protein [Chloroflexota bacterium]MEC9451358.1 hypothetical protein [Chloroflexota bacterium]MQG04125.1 hypothetical protein [SAR202 cluster bacterium]|tara:strand:- start:786 stop:1433 length:648 start_codon:yes stop_codon:yes gene_type:complete
MGTLDAKKMAGYCLMLGPIIALVAYFIQPGGVLGIGGTPDPTDSAEVIKVISSNSTLGIITSLLVPIGLITLISGLMYFVQSMQGGNGYALARTGLPFAFVSVIGWTITTGFSLSIATGVSESPVMAQAFFGINIPATALFGVGGILIALGASTREELNSTLSLGAALAATVVFITAFIVPFVPDQANTINIVTGLCFIIYTIWSIIIGRGMIKG